MRIASIVGLSAAQLLVGQLALAQPATQGCARLEEFDRITQTVATRFYDKNFRGLDWPARVATYRAKVDCADTQADLARTLNALLSELKVSHTGVYTPEDFDYWAFRSAFSRDVSEFQIAFAGIMPAPYEGEWRAKYVLPDSPAARAGVSAGDKLLRLDGRSFDPLGFKDGTDSILVISPAPDIERAVRIRARKQSIQEALLAATKDSPRVMSVGGRKVGYVHLWSGTHPLQLEALNAALGAFEKDRIDVLVFDLRGGFGGTSPEYLDTLRKGAYWREMPKYVLVDDGVRSGKELLAGMIKNERIGTLVGSKSAGAFLGASPVVFNEGQYLLLIAVAAFVPPDIGPIEGIGIEPVIAVAPCRLQCSGDDPQLTKVLDLIADLPHENQSKQG